jgi:uncharacterized membrane protein YeaQ/YmgE (transglycosylase-associated protein family)
MDMVGLLIFIGAAAGWLAGSFIKNGGFGLLGNIFIGSIGGVAGGDLFKLLGVSSGGVIGTMAAAAIGAVTLLSVIARFRKGKQSSVHYRGDELWVRRKPLNRR